MDSKTREKYVVQGRKSVRAMKPGDLKPTLIDEGQPIPSWVSQDQIDAWIVAGYIVRMDDPAYVGVIKFQELKGKSDADDRAKAKRLAAAEEARDDEKEAARQRLATSKLEEEPKDKPTPETRAQKKARMAKDARAAGKLAAKKKAELDAKLEAEAAALAEKQGDGPVLEGVWTYSPEALGEKTLEQLQVMIAETCEAHQVAVEMPESVPECIAILTEDYDPAFEEQGQ